MLLEYLAPPLAAFMAWVFLSDGLSTIEITGAVITLSGVLWVVTEKAPDKQPALSLSGIFFWLRRRTLSGYRFSHGFCGAKANQRKRY